MSSTLIAGITFSMFAILFYHVSMITCQNAPPPKKKKKMSSGRCKSSEHKNT